MQIKDASWRPAADARRDTVGEQQELSIDVEDSGLYGEYDPLRREEYGIRPGALHDEKEERRRERMRRLRRRRAVGVVAVGLMVAVAVALLVEELHMGIAFSWWMNRYTEIVQLPVTVRRAGAPPSIAIVIILKDSSHDDQYALASSTVHCYAALHSYPLRVVNAGGNETWRERCPQEDFMFHRHCVLRHLLDGMDEEWALFLDADVGVVNPNHLIEEYLPSDDSVHVVFYDRIMNHEVMAGSYLVRNSEFTRRFLQHWADASERLPNSFHGTDNGAIHDVLLSFALPHLEEERERCRELWRWSRDYATLDDFEVCTRSVMEGRSMEGIEIRNKTHGGRWCRDGWLTNSAWSQHDFMLHGWQKKRLNVLGFARWHSPLARPFGADLAPGADDAELATHCAKLGASAALEWAYKDTFMEEEEDIGKRIQVVIEEQRKIYDEKVVSLKLKN